MPTGLKRMTFVVPPDVAAPLDSMKKDFFYNQTQSEMLRELVLAGIRAIRTEKEDAREQAS